VPLNASQCIPQKARAYNNPVTLIVVYRLKTISKDSIMMLIENVRMNSDDVMNDTPPEAY
jgi:hypothetical protein